MTLTAFFDWVSSEPGWVIAYFVALPLLALLFGRWGGENVIYSPWNYLFAAIIYLVCVPGIFALTLNVYLFLFERQSIFDANIITQWLPILGMAVTLPLVQRQIDLDYVPGFGRLSGLIAMITLVLTLMWVVDRTRLWFISYLPVGYVLIIFSGLLIGMYWAAGKVFGSPYRSVR